MLFYILVWLYYFLNFLIAKRYNNFYELSVILIISIFIGFRYNVGADWGSYMNDFYVLGTYYNSSSTFEPIYSLLSILLYKLGYSHCVLFSLVCFISLYNFRKAAINFGVKNIHLFFLGYISLYLLFLNMNVIRHGAMVSFCFLAYSYLVNTEIGETARKRLFIFYSFLGVGFHYFGIVPLLFGLFYKLKISLKSYFICLVISYLLVYFDYGTLLLNLVSGFDFMFQSKIESYASGNFTVKADLSLGFIVNSLFLIVFRKLFNDEYIKSSSISLLMNFVLFSLLFSSLFDSNIAFSERFNNTFNISRVLLVPLLIQNLSRRHYQYVFVSVYIVYLLLYYVTIIHTPDPSGYKTYQFYPFVLNFNQ